MIRRNSASRVANRDAGLLPLSGHAQPNLPPLWGVLSRVVEHVADHLRNASRISVHEHGLLWERNLQALIVSRDDWLDRFQGRVDQTAELNPLGAQRDFSPADSRNVQQIVDQSGHLSHLPLHHPAQLVQLIGVVLRETPQLQRIAQWGQWVSQLVSERGQEFVLAAIGLPQLIDEMQSLLSDRQPLGHFPFKLPLTLSDPTPRSLQPLAKQGDGNSAGAIKENSHRFAAGRNRKRMLGIDKEKPLVDEADERR